ncbi:MAG: ABC transporter ATP-binding protein [Myxococcota bacterium]
MIGGGHSLIRAASLEIDRLHMVYPTGVVGLHELSLRVAPGERVAVLGPNGSGKTTLVKCVAGLLAPSAGRIRVGGRDTADGPRYLESIGAVFEGGHNVYRRLTPFENARYFADLRGAYREGRVRGLLDQFAIPAPYTQSVGELSTGGRQRVALVCALAHDPTLVLLDEPTLGLDAAAVASVKAAMRELSADRSTSFLVTSHDLSFVEDVCDRFVVLRHGRVIFDGDLGRLRASLSGYRIRLSLAGGSLDVAVETAADAMALLAGVDRADVRDIDVRARPLEDLYLNLLDGAP